MGSIIALLALGLSATFFYVAGSFPHLAADPGGPALFPRIAALITAAASIGVLIQEVGKRRLLARENASMFQSVRFDREQFLVFGTVAALPFGIQYVGFVAATFGFALIILLGLRVRPVSAAIASSLTAAGLYVAYAIILGAVLPSGQLLAQ